MFISFECPKERTKEKGTSLRNFLPKAKTARKLRVASLLYSELFSAYLAPNGFVYGLRFAYKNCSLFPNNEIINWCFVLSVVAFVVDEFLYFLVLYAFKEEDTMEEAYLVTVLK